MQKQSEEVYKICQNCGKLIKWKDRICSYCGAPCRKPQFTQIRGSLSHPINSNKNFRSVTRKRPISIILIVFLGIFFLLTILIFPPTSPFPLMTIIICFPVFTIITFSLIFVNLRKNKKRMISFLISTFVLITVLIVSSFFFSNTVSRIDVSKDIPNNDSLTTTIVEQTMTTESITSTQNITTDKEETETNAEDINKSLPTLKLVVYEGPVIVDSDLCYYRIEVVVSGNPSPVIKFSKDDSNGAWGENKAQINLKNGESYNLIVTAVNLVGKVSEHILLTWSQ